MEITMIRKRFLPLLLCMVMGCGMLSACGIKSNTPVIGRLVGLNDDQVFKIGKVICTKPEYMFFVLDNANRMSLDLGGNVDWKKNVTKDETLEEYLMNKTKMEVSTKYTMTAIAKSAGIKLTDQEETQIEEAASTYYNGLTQEEKDFTGAKQKDVVKVYKNLKLADKIFEKETDGVDVTVSDEEARVIKVQYIRMNVKSLSEDKINSKLKEVRKIVKNNWQPFSREAKQYSLDSSIEKTIKKNEAVSEFDKEAFKLANKQMSNVLTVGDDRFLIYCVNSYLKDESAANKASIIKEKKEDTFALKYDNYLEDNSTDFNDRSIKDVELSSKAGFAHANLINVYNTIK